MAFGYELTADDIKAIKSADHYVTWHATKGGNVEMRLTRRVRAIGCRSGGRSAATTDR